MEKSRDAATKEANGPGLRVVCAAVIPAAATLNRHSEIAILVPAEGAHAELARATFLDEQAGSELRPPLIAIIPAHCSDRLEWRTRAEVTTLFISPGLLQAMSEELALTRCADVRETLVVLDPVIRHVAEDLRAMLQSQHPCDGLYLESVAFLITSRLLRSYCDVSDSNIAPDGLPRLKLRRAVEFIESQLADAISVRDIAAVVDMSPYHFTRLFKRATGHTPYQCVTIARMERAKTLLRERGRSQIDIALSVGYESQSHFATVFRRIVGLTPGAYRRLYAGDRAFVPIANRITTSRLNR